MEGREKTDRELLKATEKSLESKDKSLRSRSGILESASQSSIPSSTAHLLPDVGKFLKL